MRQCSIPVSAIVVQSFIISFFCQLEKECQHEHTQKYSKFRKARTCPERLDGKRAIAGVSKINLHTTRETKANAKRRFGLPFSKHHRAEDMAFESLPVQGETYRGLAGLSKSLEWAALEKMGKISPQPGS
jgi:hypothetical protein